MPLGVSFDKLRLGGGVTWLGEAITSVVLLNPAGSQSEPGSSILTSTSISPEGPGRDVKLYWKRTVDPDSSYQLIGSATFNASNGRYEKLWIFPSCAQLSPPDQNAEVKVEAIGGDFTLFSVSNDGVVLNGRGC